MTEEQGMGEPSENSNATQKSRESAAAKLIRLGEEWDCFCSPDYNPFVTLRVDDHFETHSAKSFAFRRLVKGLYFRHFKNAVSEHAVAEAISHFESRALLEGKTTEVFTRVGSHDGEIYIDLGGPKWHAVAITREGWHVHEAPPVKFKRANGMLALPEPVRHDGSLKKLTTTLLNVSSEEDRTLLLAWIIAAMRPTGPFPVLVLNSEQGSGKTSVAKMLRRLIDPNEAPIRSQPKDERDLIVAASNGWVIGFDNLSAHSRVAVGWTLPPLDWRWFRYSVAVYRRGRVPLQRPAANNPQRH
jgi:hypothetical protein